ncbi:MAG: siroheme synthase CysG [Gammaproteobacteria bacterium]|nr:siroheme synthase CysG [Gammaproteobacteria bacterium]
MDYLPAFLNIKGRPCLIVGGGEVAARKAGLLLRAGAILKVVAPEIGGDMADLAKSAVVSVEQRAFVPDDLLGPSLVIAATDDAALNLQVSDLARNNGLPVNVVDQPDLCTFIMPSIVDRSPVLVAVSTGGASPVLARLIRARLETLIPSGFGQLALLAREFRDEVKKRIKESGMRRRFWEHVLDGPIAEMTFAGRADAARRALRDELDTGSGSLPTSGEVYLVGAGPGDPDLLTSRAIRLMQRADVVVHDRLVSEAVLRLARQDAPRIYAGKERSRHMLPQETINQLLVRLAREGKRVLRLKGGDPFIFGRGGEEIDTLAEEGIPFQIVPGITAASGCAAYAGIPLTHRDYAHSCVFVTGHLKDGSINLDWELLAKPQQTVVVYMGLVGLPVICEELIKRGSPKDLPAALIEHGTTASQRIFTGTLATLPGIVDSADVRAPTLTIIGEVVKLHGKLKWFESYAASASENAP